MSIIAYASAHADPINNPDTEATVDLATASVPASVNLYGAAVDSADPAATFSWAWSISSPASGGPTLSSATTQNVTISNISTWLNVRVKLIAMNTATSQTSETNILLAPSCSFSEIRVLSPNRGIQKPAQGARSWHPVLDIWADRIEDSGAASTQILSDLTDVSSSTGAQVDVLTGGGLAESGGAALHTHGGDAIANATPTTAGVVILDESTAASPPRCLVNERLVYSGSAYGSQIKGGASTDTIGFQSPSTTQIIPHVIFYAHEALEVHSIAIVLVDGGINSPSNKYIFDLCVGSYSALTTRQLPAVGVGLTGVPVADNEPLVLGYNYSSGFAQIAAGEWFGIGVIQEASTLGRQMQVTIHTRRAV